MTCMIRAADKSIGKVKKKYTNWIPMIGYDKELKEEIKERRRLCTNMEMTKKETPRNDNDVKIKTARYLIQKQVVTKLKEQKHSKTPVLVRQEVPSPTRGEKKIRKSMAAKSDDMPAGIPRTQ